MTVSNRYHAIANALATRARGDAAEDFIDQDGVLRELLATAVGRGVAAAVLAGGVSTQLAARVVFQWVLTAKRLDRCDVQSFMEYCAGLTVEPPEVLPGNVHTFCAVADDWEETFADEARATRVLDCMGRILSMCARLDTKLARWDSAALAHVIVACHDASGVACPPSTRDLVRSAFEYARDNRTMRRWELEEFDEHLRRVCGELA